MSEPAPAPRAPEPRGRGVANSDPPDRPRVATTWVPLFAFPLVEYLALTTAVDATELSRLPGARHLGVLGTFAICAVTALALVGGAEIRAALAAGRDERVQWTRRPRALATHVLSYLAFFALTFATSRGLVPTSSVPDVILGGAWLALGAATLVSWAALSLPLALRRWAAQHGPRATAVALAVGAAALAAGHLLEQNWRHLARGTLYLAAGLLSLGRGELWADPTRETPRLGIDDFYVDIAPECSGAEGMGLMAVLLTSYIVLFRRELRFPRALLAVPIGLLAAFAGNAARIAALVWVGRYVSMEIALRGFHSKAGWVAFCAIALALVSLTRRFAAKTEVPRGALVEGPVSAYIGPEVALLAASLLTGLFAPGPDALYAVRLVAAGAVVYVHRDALRGVLATKSSSAPVAIAAGVAVYGVWLVLADDSPTAEGLTGFLEGLPAAARVAWIALRVAGGVLVVPLVEELAFRGFAMRWAESRAFDEVDPRVVGARGIVLSSIVFGALHSSFLAATAAGVAYAYVYRRRGRLGDAVLAHAVTNALLAIEAVALGHYERW